jgi:hypothetical protein
MKLKLKVKLVRLKYGRKIYQIGPAKNKTYLQNETFGFFFFHFGFEEERQG